MFFNLNFRAIHSKRQWSKKHIGLAVDIKQIRYFLSLADTLSFTDAADDNHISQPSLSKAIQRLEDEVGGVLIHRDGKHTRLTELGRKLRGDFELIAQSEIRAREIANLHSETGGSDIRLGISNSLGPQGFADFLGAFTKANPGVRIVLHQVDATSTQEQILSGMLDACICSHPGKPNFKIKTTCLFPERLMIAMAQDHPLTELNAISVADIEGYPYLDRLNCEFRPTFVERIKQMGIAIDSPLQSDREDWIQQLVAGGHGITSLSEYSRVVPGIVLRPVTGVELARKVSLISILGSTASKAVRTMEKMARHYDWKSHLGEIPI